MVNGMGRGCASSGFALENAPFRQPGPERPAQLGRSVVRAMMRPVQRFISMR